MSIAEQYIRKCAAVGQIKYSAHAVIRMGERCILRPLVDDAILNGQVIEQQDNPDEDIKVLFQEATSETPSFYVVVAACMPEVEVVTVARFEEEAWEFVGKITRRRRRPK